MTERADRPPFLSIVIPAYNEEARLGETLRRINEYLASRSYNAEIIVVDDGSTDRTRDVAARALGGRKGDRILGRTKNLGKGASVKEGVLSADGRWILITDADLSTPIEEIEKMLPEIERGADIVIGSRAMDGSDIQVRQNRAREWMGKMFNVLVRMFVLGGIRDTQCGFKLFRREAVRAIFPSLCTRGFCFDVEALYLGLRRNMRIVQVPVVWRNSPVSKVRIVGASARMLWDLLQIRRRYPRAGRDRKRGAGT